MSKLQIVGLILVLIFAWIFLSWMVDGAFASGEIPNFFDYSVDYIHTAGLTLKKHFHFKFSKL